MIHLRLKEAIASLDLKYEDFGKQINLDVNAIRNMASNRKVITPEIALDIEKAFGINPCWLIFGRGDMKTAQMDLEQKGEPLSYEELYEKVEKLTTAVSDIQSKYNK